MEFSAKMIAEYLHGQVEGNPEVVLSTVSKIEEAQAGSLCFLANPKYTHFIYSTQASAVLVSKDFVPAKPLQLTLIRVDDPYEALAQLLELAEQQMKPVKKGIHELAYIHPGAEIGKDCYIGPFSVISDKVRVGDQCQIYPHVYIGENSRIGKNSILYPGVKIYHSCQIGNQCIIHAGSVVGSDGFGFAPKSDKNYRKIPQIGNVIIEDDVEIGANTTIDRATMGSTIVRKGVKLDNMVQIAHNVEVGDNTVIAAQSGIAGSTRVGKNCMMGGQSGIVGHLTVADNVKMAAKSGVTSNIKIEGEAVQGAPSFNFTRYQKSYVYFRKFPEVYAKIEALEKEIQELKKNG